jgi:hypothetical protein
MKFESSRLVSGPSPPIQQPIPIFMRCESNQMFKSFAAFPQQMRALPENSWKYPGIWAAPEELEQAMATSGNNLSHAT